MTQLIVPSLHENMYFVISRTVGKKHKNNPTVSVSFLDTYILSTLSLAYWWVKKDWKEKKLVICSIFLFPSIIPVPISYSVTNLKSLYFPSLHLPELPCMLENSVFMEHSKCSAPMDWHRVVDTYSAALSAIYARAPLPPWTSLTKTVHDFKNFQMVTAQY